MSQTSWVGGLGAVFGLVYIGTAPSWTEAKYLQRADAWKVVMEAEEKNLPKTALERLEPIFQEALREKDYPELLQALCRKIELEAEIQSEDQFPDLAEKIRRLQKEIVRAPKPIQPLQEAILVPWCGKFWEEREWHLAGCTAAAQPDRVCQYPVHVRSGVQ